MPDLTTADIPPASGLLLAGRTPAPQQDQPYQAPSDLKQTFSPPEKSADQYQSPADVVAQSPNSHAAGFATLIKNTMQFEGEGKDPRSSAVGGFLNDEWLKYAKGTPETTGLSDQQILDMRYDNSPKGRAFREHMWAKEFTGIAQEYQNSGIPVNNGTLYLGELLGGPDATKVMRADPNTPVEAVLSDKVITANPQYRGLTTGQMVNFSAKKMDGQGDPFTHHQAGMEAIAQLTGDQRQATESSIAQLTRDQAAILAAANEAPPGSAERIQMLHEAHDHARELTKLYEQKINAPPERKPTDLFGGWGGIVIALAALAGRRSAQPLTAALNGMAGAMDAMNQGNERDFKDRMAIWDKQSSYALKAVELQNQDIREILEDQRMAESEKQARLNTLYHAAGMDQQIALQRSGQIQQAQTNLYHMLDLQQRADHENERIHEWKMNYDRLLDRTPAQQKFIDQYLAQLPPDAPPEQRSAAMLEAEKKWKAASAGTSELSEESVKLMAKQYEMGDLGVITSLPRGGPARIQVENQIAEDMRGMDDGAQKIVRNRIAMTEATAAARRAGSITMSTETFAVEAEKAGEQLVKTSEAFDRTNFPKINQALIAYETNTGDPNIIKFGASVNALLNAYGKMSNPTGTGIHDADKERLSNILSTALSKGQIRAGVDQIIIEGRVISDAAIEAQRRTLSQLTPEPAGTQKSAPTGGSPSSTQGKPDYSKMTNEELLRSLGLPTGPPQ